VSFGWPFIDFSSFSVEFPRFSLNFTLISCNLIDFRPSFSILSEIKTKNTSKLFRKPNPTQFLPRFPVRINIETWWQIEIGLVLESDIRFVNEKERAVIDDLIDFGSQLAGNIDHNVVHSLYRKGLIYLDVPISGELIVSIR
jgi:hypothetical protein